jgi:5-methylcytosine-specific restriction protein A
MLISTDILDKLYNDFTNFIATKDGQPFVSFTNSLYFDEAEKYKEKIYDEARETIRNGKWKPEDIGTGKVHHTISDAIKTKVIHRYKSYDNNLINHWTIKDDFAKFKPSKPFEQLLFDFYKSKGIKNEVVFAELIKYGHPYNLVAYLFFIKDNKIFLPISQQRFDKIFDIIGFPNFRTSGRASWDNYATFLDIVKQVRDFLGTKDKNTTLLEAHSFLWILGNQMQNNAVTKTQTLQQTFQKDKVLPSQADRAEDDGKLSFPEGKEVFTLTPLNINTYLFVWNPKRWTWETLEDDIEQLDVVGGLRTSWKCGNTKSIIIGDRIFLIKVGTEPKGVIGAGYATSIPFNKKWNDENEESLFIDIAFEVLLNPDKEPILTLDVLKTGNLVKQYSWTPQASGITVRPDIVDELEAVWFYFLATQKIRHNPFIHDETEKMFTEGTLHQVTLSRYERNPFARKVCLEHYGYSCSVCGFNFEQVYGDVGKNFIHVHHLTQIAKIGKEYKVDPIEDLRPVCPNCHAMLHRQKVGLSIEELKSFMLTEKHRH